MSAADPTDREPWQQALAQGVGEGRRWRSVGELLDEPAFRAAIAGEFAPGCDAPPGDDAVTRRGFLKLLSASMALAGVAGACTRAPAQRIVPYNVLPPEVTPGVASYYATTFVRDGYGVGLLAESHEGRPTKLEGNPDHPASLGGTGAIEQASVLSLYDPSRARFVTHAGEPAAFAEVAATFGAGIAPRGRGLGVLLEPTSSPLRASLIARVRRSCPEAQVFFHAAVTRDAQWAGNALAFGAPADDVLDLAAADVLVALDADVLHDGPFALRYARQFAARRTPRTSADEMNRLYVVEPGWTPTGMAADHRFRVRRSDVPAVVAALATQLLAPNAALGPLARFGLAKEHRGWVGAMADDLRANTGRAVLVAGRAQPPEVHALVAAMNVALGAVGHTVSYVAPAVLEAGAPSHDARALARALASGAIDTLLVLGGNPVYGAPVDLGLGELIRRLPRALYLGPYANETARACAWHVPEAHALESWGDARALDGTASLVQPLVAPMYAGRTVDELLALVAGDPAPDAHRLLEASWRGTQSAADFERLRDQALQRGVLDASASPPLATTTIQWETLATRLAAWNPPEAHAVEVVFAPDLRVHDGAHTNNAWLLELPDPVSKLTWDNAVLLAPATAASLGVSTEDLLEITVAGRTLRAPALVLPGQADASLTLTLGFGRDGDEALARGLGYNATSLRTTDALWNAPATVRRVGGTRELATTQEHWSLEGRPEFRELTLAQWRRDPHALADANRRPELLYTLRPDGANQWAMAIDLSACTGCSACVVACQAENNIPVVGKEGVRKSREMHWLRIDRYFGGTARDATAVVQPMLCQHCESAPCEYVCPVAATVHSPDGLNEMVYNRCVGTRFCSNNCPYKVRRFNYLDWHHGLTDTEALVMNPDVTVRSRGVMEKCSFCVQRIREHEITARAEQRAIRDGEVVTACAQACPSRAITFGSIADRASEVATLQRSERAYRVLGELGTQPRVRYLARVTNPNPALVRGEETA